MLDKTRNNLIASAFRKANITSLESDPTAAEIEDAAHVLNVMLQSWNNDGFRLFKIKTGFMPFLPHVNEYALATQAYDSFESCLVSGFERTGAAKIVLKDWNNVSAGQKIIVLNNVPNSNTINSIDFESKVLTLENEMQEPLYSNDVVFYGNDFSMAQTETKTFENAFQTISFSGANVTPSVGDSVYFNLKGSWIKSKIYSVDTNAKTITLADSYQAGAITNSFIFYGTSVYRTNLIEDYPIEARVVYVQGLKDIPQTMAVVGSDKLGDMLEVERASVVTGSLDTTRLLLKSAISDEALVDLGDVQINALITYPTSTLVEWSDLSALVPITELDWGSVADSSPLVTDDWGYVTDAATVLEDWGTLTGAAEITGFAKSANDLYVTVYDNDNDVTYLFHKNLNSDWETVDVSSYSLTKSTLGIFDNQAYLIDPSAGVYNIVSSELIASYTDNGVEKVIKFGGLFYLVSPKEAGTTTRTVVSTKNFTEFSTEWTINLDSLANPAEFLNKLYIGTTGTFVTGDMEVFNDIGIYSENRSVIGDRILNMNTQQYCSFSKDGVTFYPMPLMVSSQTAWGYKDGCTFIAIYGVMINGMVGTQIYTANEFNPVWTPQVIVAGRVFEIEFDDSYAYFVSDVEVKALEYRESVVAIDGLKAYGFGSPIGRPQELMNVVKYGLNNQSQLPMNAVSLKEYSLLPHESADGEPVNYCFFRDAKDGKLLVWGTPSRFGEYLRFSYVEPITLLEGARSTPDFPDEYYEAVEDGLAAQLAMDYGLPIERQQVLVARAQESKENATLHDNEDTSYSIAPNERWK